jgi:uncharacterized protein YndB with AHSA1/START domain
VSASAVVLHRHLAEPPEGVWRAWTDPDLMSRWYCPNPEWDVTATTDVRVGGRWQVTMGRHVVAGCYTVVQAPHRLAFSWGWQPVDGDPGADPAGSLVEVVIEPDGTGSRLTLTHSELPDDDEAKGHREGWELSLERLANGW